MKSGSSRGSRKPTGWMSPTCDASSATSETSTALCNTCATFLSKRQKKEWCSVVVVVGGGGGAVRALLSAPTASVADNKRCFSNAIRSASSTFAFARSAYVRRASSFRCLSARSRSLPPLSAGPRLLRLQREGLEGPLLAQPKTLNGEVFPLVGEEYRRDVVVEHEGSTSVCTSPDGFELCRLTELSSYEDTAVRRGLVAVAAVGNGRTLGALRKERALWGGRSGGETRLCLAP
mmetsp:Transcript_8693/g.20854  ORF Transcript_8693/g.20854 Transcript_8693/m.20854 type:complete len:234 (+) Transcript_8693:697-1398(+)